MHRDIEDMDEGLFKSVCWQIHEAWLARLGTERDPRNARATTPSDRMEKVGLRLHHFGSPLADRLFIARVTWLKSFCLFPVHASISAEHLCDDVPFKLIETGIDRLVVALDGTNEENYRAVRGPRASFGRARRGIQALLEARRRLGVSTIIDIQMVDLGHDAALVHEFQRQWLGSGANTILKPFFTYPDIGMMPGEPAMWTGPCVWPFLSMVVTVDGRVVPCCADYNAEIVVGDARKNSLQDIWDGDRFRQFRHSFFLGDSDLPSLCRRCGFFGRVSI